MNILHKARRFEADLTRAVERAAQRWAKSEAREPLEIVHTIVEAVGERLAPASRGRYVFPFNRIEVSVAAVSQDDRARFAAVFDSEPTLRERIATRLRDAGCDPAALQVDVAYVPLPGPAWRTPEWHVEFARVPATQLPPALAARDLQITIVHGTAEQPSYVFTLPRVNLGRCAEVRDSLRRLIRRNHVAFGDDQDTPNHTVSRRHAHIEFVEGPRHYRIRDDRSAQGTSIVRNGKTVVVPPGARGIRLESGDEIVLGEARAQVRIGAE